MITIEKDEVEINKIKAVKSNLKAKIKDQAVLQKRTKANNKEVQREVTRCGWNSELYKREMDDLSCEVTLTHILYNRIRNRPPHTGSVESDNSYMSMYGGYSKIKKDLESRFSIELGV